MSFWQFLLTACWREAGKIARSIQIVLVTIPLLASAAIGLAGGEWSRDFWPWYWWAFVSAFVAVLSVFFGITRRAFQLEKAAQPKLKLLVGGKRIFLEVDNLAKEHYKITTARIGIQNTSIKEPVRGARVILANIVSDDGREVRDLDRTLVFNHTGGGIETLTPKGVAYLQVAKIEQLKVGKGEFHPIQIGPFAIGAEPQLREGPYTIKFRISAENSPEAVAYVSTGVRNGEFFFHAKE